MGENKGKNYEEWIKNILYKLEGNQLVRIDNNLNRKDKICDVDFEKENWKIWVAYNILKDMHNVDDWAREEAVEYLYKMVDKNLEKTAWDVIQYQISHSWGGVK